MTRDMPGAVEVDEAGFPLVVATFGGHVTEEMIAAYFARLDAWCNGPKRYASIIDISRIEMPSAAERKQIAQGIAARQDALARWCAGLAVVVTNPLLRGAVTAIVWLQRPHHPLELLATQAAARAACERWLANPPASRP